METNQTNKRERTEAAKCASEVRKELKKNFPKIKFTVRSDNFSMGDSVNVGWTDGPTTKQVEAIVKKYQYGHFDGMIDCYEYSNSIEGMPQTKYLFCNREVSEEFREAIIKAKNIDVNEWTQGDKVRKEAQEIDYTDKLHIETEEEEYERKDKEFREWEKTEEGKKICQSVDEVSKKLKEEKNDN